MLLSDTRIHRWNGTECEGIRGREHRQLRKRSADNTAERQGFLATISHSWRNCIGKNDVLACDANG